MTSTLEMLWLVRGSGIDVALERPVRVLGEPVVVVPRRHPEDDVVGVAVQPLLELAVVEVAGLAVEELLDGVPGDGAARRLDGALRGGHDGQPSGVATSVRDCCATAACIVRSQWPCWTG